MTKKQLGGGFFKHERELTVSFVKKDKRHKKIKEVVQKVLVTVCTLLLQMLQTSNEK